MKELDKKRWVNTTDVVEFLKSDPDHEHEFSRHLGGMLRSTYWMEYESDKNMFALSRDWIRPDYYTEEELLQCYEGIGGISPVRRGRDGIRPFVRSN